MRADQTAGGRDTFVAAFFSFLGDQEESTDDDRNAAVSEPAGEVRRDTPFQDATDEEWEVLLKVVQILRRTRIGTIALIVHDGRVKQIERAEKIRLR